MIDSTKTILPEQAIAIAEQFFTQGQAQQAVQLLTNSFQQHPTHSQLALYLARQFNQANQTKAALQVLNHAYAHGQRHPELCYMFAALLHVQGHHAESETLLLDYLKQHPSSAQAHNILGANYMEQNKFPEAVSAFEEAIKHSPNSADAHNNLAWAHRALGNKEAAISSFTNAYQYNKSATEALSGILMLKTFKESSWEIEESKKRLKDRQLTAKQQSELQFALGKAYEDLKAYNHAFEHFKQANRTWRKTLNYSIEEDKTLFNDIKARLTPKTSDCSVTNPTKSDLHPIFILGMPRSSTTLIEQIISAHSQVIGGGELPFLERLMIQQGGLALSSIQDPETEAISQAYLQATNQFIDHQKNQESRFVTDKLPMNFRFIGFIAAAFPQAKIIHCKRDPMDTCLSLYKHHFPMAKHGYAYQLDELGQYYQLYEDLMDHWHQHLPGKILDVQYETLLANFEPEVNRLLAFCGLDLEETCLSFQNNQRVVRTASSDQVRQGLFQHGEGRWKHYRDQLEELRLNLQSYS